MFKKIFILITTLVASSLTAAISTQQDYAFVSLTTSERILGNTYVVPFIPNVNNIIGSDIIFDNHSLQVTQSGTYKLTYNIVVRQINFYPTQDTSIAAGICVNGVQQFTEIEASQWGMDNYVGPLELVSPTRCLRVTLHHYLNAGDRVSLVLRTNNPLASSELLSTQYFGDMTANLSLYRIENVRLPFIYGKTSAINNVYGLPQAIAFSTFKENPTGGTFATSPDNKSIYFNQPGIYMASFQVSSSIGTGYQNNFLLQLNGATLGASKFGVSPFVIDYPNVFQDNSANDVMFYANAGDILGLFGTTWNPSSLGSTSVAMNVIKISGNQTKVNKAEHTFGYFNGTMPFYPNESRNVPLSSADSLSNPDFTYITPTDIKFRVGGNYKISYQLNFGTNTATVNGVPVLKPFKTQLLINGLPVDGSVWGADLLPYWNQSRASNKISVDVIVTVPANGILNLNVVTGSWNQGLASIERSLMGVASVGLSIIKVSDSN